MSKYKFSVLSLLLLFILSLTAVLAIGDFKVRIANTLCDDNPSVFYNFFRNPEAFKNDSRSSYFYTYIAGSLQNWLPILLAQLFNLSPEIPTWLFIFLQNVLLGFALFYYCRVVTRRIDLSWITVFFAFAALPWEWNLANYKSMLYSPYPGQLALPLAIFSATALIENRFSSATLFLILTGLIHPPMALYMTLFFLLFYILRFNPKEDRGLLKRIFFLGLVIAICMGPQLFIWSKPSNNLSASDLMPVMYTNFHTNPLAHDLFFSFRVPTFLGFTVLTAMALKFYKSPSTQFLTFWIASLVGMIILVSIHIAGFVWQVPRFIQLIPARATSLWIVFSLPPVMAYLFNKIEKNGFVVGWIAASIFFLHAVFSFGFYWTLILAIFFIEFSGMQKGSARQLARFLFLCWLGVVFVWGAIAALAGPRISSRPVFSILIPGVYISGAGFIFAILMAAGVGLSATFFPRKKSLCSLPALIIIMTLIGITLVKAYCAGEETRKPEAKAIYEAQLWARDNTKESSLFMLLDDIPWRTISGRPAMEIAYHGGYYLYSGSRSAKEFSDRIERFWREEGVFRKTRENISKKDLNEQRIMRLAKIVDADYIVCKAEDDFDFFEAFRNSSIVVYKLYQIGDK